MHIILYYISILYKTVQYFQNIFFIIITINNNNACYIIILYHILKCYSIYISIIYILI